MSLQSQPDENMTERFLDDRLRESDTVADGSACGPDMEYAGEFLAFQALATPKEEQQLGDTIIPARDPDWRDVFKTGCALLEKSRDLRILSTVACAALHQKGLPAFAESLELMEQWLIRYWDDLHPALSVDGEYDPLMRTNAIAALADRTTGLRALRATTLLESPIGPVTLSQAERLIANKPVEDACPVSSPEQLARMVADERTRNLPRFEALARIDRALHAIYALIQERLESEYWPELTPLTELTARLRHLVDATQSDVTVADDAAQSPASESAAAPVTARAAAGLPASIDKRSEAFQALALARAYFERHEPSHPAPLIIRRIERLANLDFLEIVRELTPEGLQQLQFIAGSSDGDGR